MNSLTPFVLLLFLCVTACGGESVASKFKADASRAQTADRVQAISPYQHNWNPNASKTQTILNEIEASEGAKRATAAPNSFGHWLRHLPLKDAGKRVKLYNGSEKPNQEPTFRIIDIDVGKKDLQQCADAVMRLRAEYLWEMDKKEEIAFNFTSGHRASWKDWSQGIRPVIKGNTVKFSPKAKKNSNYPNFRSYLDVIFTYAGTLSLSKEVKSIPAKELVAGDFLIWGGSPGHAMLIVDTSIGDDGNVYFLLAQSYMPAQEMHIVKNLNDSTLSPWFKVDESAEIKTPEWTFSASAYHRFP